MTCSRYLQLSLFACISLSISGQWPIRAADADPLVCNLVLVDGRIQSQVDIGEVFAGSRHTRRIRLVNSLDETLAFNVVAPSCNCVQVAIPQSELDRGESVDGTINLSVPQSRGNQTIASIKLSRSDIPFKEIRLQINGTIRRPIEFRMKEFNVRVREREEFKLAIPFQIDPDVELSDVQVTILPNRLNITTTRETPNAGSIQITDKNLSLDESNSYRLTIKSTSDNQQFTDQISVNLIDATLTRVLPASVELDGSLIRVMFVRESGVDGRSLRSRTTGGTRIPHQVRFIGDRIARIQISPSDISDQVKEIEICDVYGSVTLKLIRPK